MSQEDRKDDRVAVPPADGELSPDAAAAQPATASDTAPTGDTGDLRAQLQAKTEEAARHYDLFVRERAELENFKKRMARERAEALRFATEPLVRDLLPVVDNLERALAHGEGNGDSLLEGLRLVVKDLLDTFERHGVTRIDARGEAFDPARHEAIAQVESPDHPPNHVVDQYQSGYMLHDRLLRPARVTVSGRKPGAGVESPPNSD